MIYGYSTSLQYSSDTEIFSIIISRFSVFLPSKFQFFRWRNHFLVRSEGAEAAEKCFTQKGRTQNCLAKTTYYTDPK